MMIQPLRTMCLLPLAEHPRVSKGCPELRSVQPENTSAGDSARDGGSRRRTMLSATDTSARKASESVSGQAKDSYEAGHVTDFYHPVKPAMQMKGMPAVAVTKTRADARSQTTESTALSQNREWNAVNSKVEPSANKTRTSVERSDHSVPVLVGGSHRFEPSSIKSVSSNMRVLQAVKSKSAVQPKPSSYANPKRGPPLRAFESVVVKHRIQETADKAHDLELELEASRNRLKFLAREREKLKVSQPIPSKNISHEPKTSASRFMFNEYHDEKPDIRFVDLKRQPKMSDNFDENEFLDGDGNGGGQNQQNANQRAAADSDYVHLQVGQRSSGHNDYKHMQNLNTGSRWITFSCSTGFCPAAASARMPYSSC